MGNINPVEFAALEKALEQHKALLQREKDRIDMLKRYCAQVEERNSALLRISTCMTREGVAKGFFDRNPGEITKERVLIAFEVADVWIAERDKGLQPEDLLLRKVLDIHDVESV